MLQQHQKYQQGCGDNCVVTKEDKLHTVGGERELTVKVTTTTTITKESEVFFW